MTPSEAKKLEEFLEEALGFGVCFRELRLSLEEVAYAKARYPRASFKKCGSSQDADGKTWWEIRQKPF